MAVDNEQDFSDYLKRQLGQASSVVDWVLLQQGLETVARLAFAYYRALRHAGFTRSQAVTIIAAHGVIPKCNMLTQEERP